MKEAVACPRDPLAFRSSEPCHPCGILFYVVLQSHVMRDVIATLRLRSSKLPSVGIVTLQATKGIEEKKSQAIPDYLLCDF